MRTQRFNGATRLHAWKQREAVASGQVRSLLQWGHASSRVETRKPALMSRAKIDASMGPRVFTRGNSTTLSLMLSMLDASMGPRVFTRGNKHGADFPLYRAMSFNGATRLHAWKPACKRSATPTRHALQWGHASSRVETSHQCRR